MKKVKLIFVNKDEKQTNKFKGWWFFIFLYHQSDSMLTIS